MTKLQQKPTVAVIRRRRPARSMSPLRLHVLAAIFQRDFLGYFSNLAGYVFIALFVLVCSWAEFWQPVFFANNLANLDPLNQAMPYILLFFIPAITMSTWADERRQGTDELLLTLPARDVEVVLGKYFAALGIYTVALLFLALGHFPLFRFLGSPDPGILLANFLGYWLMGVLLISLGMVASIVSSNVTVAFILGAVFCGVPVFARLLSYATAGPSRRIVENLSIAEQFRDFGAGVITLSGALYFVTLAAAMLYLNMILLGRRHWAGGQESAGRWGHAATRVVALVLALVSLDVIVQKTFGSLRADVTEERLHTLSPESIKLIKAIPRDRPVFIQAYLSPEVPREFVQTRMDLINTLKEFAAIGGERIRLNIVETERYSTAARDAEKRFGIIAKRVPTIDEAKQSSREITLGVAFSSGLEEVVIPFFDRGLPVEYEVTRSMRVVSGSKRKKVGILGTDAKLLGGVNFQTMTPEGEWSIVTELKKQYEVTQISPDAPIPADLDGLIVAQPSSMPQRQIDHLTKYVRAGGPTLLLLDPLPVIDPDLAPTEPRRPPGGMFGGAPQPEPKGRLAPLLNLLGIEWPANEVVWNNYNPHKQLDLPPGGFVFVTKDLATDAFGRDPSSSGLQELVFRLPGVLRHRPGATTEFHPLVRTDDLGGTVTYEDILSGRAFGGRGRADNLIPGLQSYTLAARILGPLPADVPPPFPGSKTPTPPAMPAKANVIVVADLDFLSDSFFELRKRPVEALDAFDFDNVNFVLNCVDELAGNETFIPLRNRRSKHRTLLAVEEQSKQYVKKAEEETKAAKEEARTQLAEAQKRLDTQVAEVRANKELDARTKETMVRYREAVENRKLDVIKAEINDREQRRIEDAKAAREEGIQRIQKGVRVWALGYPPMPPLLLGGLIAFIRSRRENRGTGANRLA
ncbi:MAG: ABC-type uncharacterized transport system involved in gliding motility, auxiliary component [Planctomycetota bacterium]|nr:ABC-type uncharacterized transport system involved in gliding motility, auxiliary component [Planctomycetota bacterium]